MDNKPWLVIAAAALLVACGGGGGGDAGPAAPSAQFVVIATPAGYAAAQAPVMSADGSVAAASAIDSAGRAQAFRWSASGSTLLGLLPGGTHAAPTGISNDGNMIVGNADTGALPPASSAVFRWTASGGMTRVPPPSNAAACGAGGVSGDGAIVVGTCLATNNAGFIYDGVVRTLNQYGGGLGAASTVISISRDGTVIGGAGNPRLTGAMTWNASDLAPNLIGRFNVDDEFATATIAQPGRAFGYSQDSQGRMWMFRWTRAAGMERLTSAAGGTGGTYPAAASDAGTRVVGWTVQGGADVAAIWDATHGLRTVADALATDYGLTLAGWNLQRATSISANGRVVAGTGVSPAGTTQAWLVRLPD